MDTIAKVFAGVALVLAVAAGYLGQRCAAHRGEARLYQQRWEASEEARKHEVREEARKIAQTEFSDTYDQRKSEEEKLRGIQAQLAEKTRALDAATADLKTREDAITQKTAAYRSMIAEKEQALSDLGQRTAGQEGVLAGLTAEAQKAKEDIEALKAKLDVLRASNAQADLDRAALTVQRRAIEEEIASLKLESDQIRKEIEDLKKQKDEKK